MRTVVFAAMVAIAMFGTPPSAVTQVEFYQEGNRLYQEGDFEGALASYLRLVEAGFESGEVYYNIGNTYFKLGNVALSILYYERARRLLPGDEDVQANLDLARSLTVTRSSPSRGSGSSVRWSGGSALCRGRSSSRWSQVPIWSGLASCSCSF